ncbi:hypothetical protein [Ornithinimicrobium avium]|uniref:hypothetical protein n=1 Tax=Ornithinimicrobium avium TaxID=2283195 RepID=UPI0013B3B1B0|nr:hypothetical protein [Ornithinimicrobium avium]
MSGITLDAGPLIQLDRGDRRVILLLARAESVGARVVIPRRLRWRRPSETPPDRPGWRGCSASH